MNDLIALIPLFPLAAFLINGLGGRWVKEGGGWVAVIAMAMSAFISVFLFVEAWIGAEGLELPITKTYWTWMAAGSLEITVGLHFDELTAVMCFVVTFVGSLVFLYSIGYMHGDPGVTRFFAYLSLFAFSMLVLVLADSLVLLFVGWEGVGLCSYLLIGYYLDMKGAPDAGKKAFIVNRIGDFGFLLAMFLIYHTAGTLKIADLVDRESAEAWFAYGGAGITLITLLLLLGCTGKSAQIPLFIWLPDAMAGPTPVSALIHAATMVTAGVYLVARTSVLFVLAPTTLVVMAVVGAATAFVAGSIALTQRDIKKVLAYSTVSQLGYMFMGCGVGAFAAGIFHVVTHAFFKGCLFLGAGAIIHAIGGNQDLFAMGGLRKKLPVTWATFAVASLAISGFFLTAGFFSKDEILWKTFVDSPDSTRLLGVPMLWVAGIVTALMTAVYSFRALFLAFHGAARQPGDAARHVRRPPWTMAVPLIILAAGSLLAGFMNAPGWLAERWGGGEGLAFEHFLTPVLGDAAAIAHEYGARPEGADSHALEFPLALFSAFIAVVGIGFAFVYWYLRWPEAATKLAARFNGAYRLSQAGWWWDPFYNSVFARGVRRFGFYALMFDTLIIDGLLHVTAAAAREGSRAIRGLQMGQVQLYALVMLIGANVLLAVILLW